MGGDVGGVGGRAVGMVGGWGVWVGDGEEEAGDEEQKQKDEGFHSGFIL